MLNTKDIPYVYIRDGHYYFNRRVPMDLQGHYRCPRIIVSLRTKSAQAANTKSVTLAAQLEEEWLTLRWRQKDNPLGRFLISNDEHSYAPSDAPLMSEVKSIYVTVKSDGRSLAFSQAVGRAVSNLIDAVGDKPIDRYSRKDVNQLRDQLFDRGLSKTSIKRLFGTIRAMVNFVGREHGLPVSNTFSGIYLGEDTHRAETRRLPIPLSDIRFVQKQCEQVNDECRWLIALISDTGTLLFIQYYNTQYLL